MESKLGFLDLKTLSAINFKCFKQPGHQNINGWVWEELPIAAPKAERVLGWFQRRRQLMNFVLVTTAGIPVLVALGCYLWYFVPPVSGGGGGAQLAGDVDGNPVTLDSWVKSHKDNDRELVQGLKGEPYYLISTPDNIKDFALLSVCTHLGCVVPWNKAANKFCCPCHGSQYDENGKVVRGPAPLSLALAHTTTLEGKLALSPWPEQDFRTGLDPWWKWVLRQFYSRATVWLCLYVAVSKASELLL